MSNDWLISNQPRSDHVAWSDRGGFLLASPSWARLTASLGAQPLFGWSPLRRFGVVIPVFRRIGIRIGFLGFPVGGAHWDDCPHTDIENEALNIARAADVNLIRVTRSSLGVFDARAVSARPELWIDDLPVWDLTERKKLRKDLGYARRGIGTFEIVSGCADAGACFDLYAATVEARSGRMRYTRLYFECLREIAKSSDRLRIVSALGADGTVRGFSVLAMHGDVGYYLHSAVDKQAKRQGISDLLLESLVAFARDAGCKRFTFMSSPWDQPGLIRFKEKWGDTQGLSLTYDVAVGLLGSCVRLGTRWQSRSDRYAALAWNPSQAQKINHDS